MSNPASDDPRSVLEAMKNEFVASVGGLVTITRDDIIEYDRALYGVLTAKPSKRLSATLSVQREIVVLVCNFRRLQVRTIRAVLETIHESGGRYEAGLAIIVHQDPGGDSLLQNWGREQNITILPVYRTILQAEDTELETALRNALFSHDAFDVTGPVSSDAQFFGRRTEAQDLARALQLGQIRSLLGIRKIGKTSIINRIIGELEHYDCSSLMIDCSKDEIWSMKDTELLMSIGSAINRCEKNTLRYAAITGCENQGETISAAVEYLQSAILQIGKPVIIFFDEIDYITPASPTSDYWRDTFNKFWRNFRAVYQEITRTEARLSIVVSGVSSKWFSVGEIDGIENAAMAFIPEEYLSPLPRGASVAMVKKVGRVAGLQFDEASAYLLAEESADMPFWIRKAGSFIHRNVSIEGRPTTIDKQRCEVLLESYIEKEGAIIAELALTHLFRVYPDLLKTTEAIASDDVDSANISQRKLGVLQKYGIVTAAQAKRISGRMIRKGFELFLEDREENGVSQSGGGGGQAQEGGGRLDKWADDLAVLNRQRNIVEKRFREVALNFIKMDSMQNKEKKSPRDRVLAVFEERRKNIFTHLSADEAIEKYNWTDLVTLLSKKEWVLFERMIGDKNKFVLNANVVNDRPDAHAKSIDEADFALYRRALKQLEEILEKLG